MRSTGDATEGGGQQRAVRAAAIAAVVVAGLTLTRCETTAPAPAFVANAGQLRSFEWQRPIDVARGRAHTGPWRMNESNFDYVDDASVAVREDGVIGVVWVDNHEKDVFFRAYARSGEALTERVDVSKSPAVFSWLPRLVMGSDNRVFVLWQEIVFSGGSHGGDIFFARSADGGQSFDPPQNLSNSQDGDGKGRVSAEHWHNGSLDLVRGRAGELFAAWTSYEGALSFSRSADGGRSWSAPLHIAGDWHRPARAPALAIGSDAEVHLAWTVGHDPEADIHVVDSADAGQSFGSVVTVRDGAGHADAPKLAVDASGVLHLCYTQSSSGFFGPHRVRYARREPRRGFESSRVIAGPPRESAGASFPALAVRQGHVYISWEHHPNGMDPARGLGFVHSGDAGNSFTPSALIPGTTEPALGVNGSRQGKLTRKLAVDASGLIAVADSRFRYGEESSVRLIRGW